MDLQKQVVHTTSLFEVDDKFEDSRFMRVKIAAMHSGINRNNSKFSVECIKAAKDTFANIPILADVQEHEDEYGNHYLDYSGHSMHIETDAMDGESDRLVYDEKVVGIVPETNNFELVHDDETGNDYAIVEAILFREYGNYVCDILEKRGGKTDVSAEIACAETSYSAEEKCLNVGKMQMCAITLLGDDVTPGMEKAHAEVFSHNEGNRQDQLIKIMQELKDSLDNYNALLEQNTKEGGNVVDNEILNEVLESTEDVVEEVTEETTEEVTTEEEFSEDVVEETPAEEVVEEEQIEESENVVVEENSIKFNITNGEEIKEFAVSLSDVIYALNELVNETYSDEGTYYSVDVFAEDGYVIMVDYMTGRAYKQSFKCKKKQYSLHGDRVPVRAIYVTEDEENKLNEMRSNYSSISDKLSKYEAEPEKMNILNSEEYCKLADTKEFNELKERDAHFDMSVDELVKACDDMLLKYAKSGKLDFSVETENDKVGMKTLPIETKKSSRYGNLFSK